MSPQHQETIISPQFSFLEDFVRTIDKNFFHGGEVIYNDRNQIRVFTLPSGMKINVKRYKKPIFIQQVVYSLFRKPKAKRAYTNASKLKALNIPTPTPIACILNKKCGFLTHSYLITEQVPFTRNFYEFGKGRLSGRENIIIEFAKFTADLHKKGVYHKDYSPGNILFDIVNGHPEFCLVDINRMKFGTVSLGKGCKNFARLWGKPDLFYLLAESYSTATNANKDLCKRKILKARENFWKKRNHGFYEYE